MARRTSAWRAACLLSILSCAALAAADAPRISANLRSGAIESRQTPQVGSRIHRGRAEGIVDAPFDRVMNAIQDYANYYRFMPNFRTSRVLSRRGNKALLYIEVNALHGLTKLWAEVKVGARDVPPPARFIDAKMTRGNLKQFEAAWQVTPISESQTLVAFELCADPDLPLAVGAGLVSDQNEKEARSSIRALREYVAARSAAAH
jgi:ribosome-associated toxin RatA of RatAB toxin-antitoxin module